MESSANKGRYWTRIFAYTSLLTCVPAYCMSVVFDSSERPAFSAEVIWGVSFLTGISAIIGMLARRRVGFSIICALIGITVSGLFITKFVQYEVEYWNYPGTRACASNTIVLGCAMSNYCEHHDGRFPPPENWNSAISKYVTRKSAFVCPRQKDQTLPSYAMNARLKGLRETDVADPSDTVMIYESIEGKNQHGGPELFTKKSRHMGYSVSFADYHARNVSESELAKLNWDPRK